MKTRESGMPDESMWAGFFSPEQTLVKLGLTGSCRDVVDFGFPVALDVLNRRVDSQRTDRQHGILAVVTPPHQCLDSGKQFLELERLNEVIIRPCVQTGNPIGHGVLRCDDENVALSSLGSQPTEDAQAIQSGKHKVQHDHVVLVALGVPQRLFTVTRDIDGKAGLAKSLDHRFLERRIVFDQQQPHHTVSLSQPSVKGLPCRNG